MFASPYNTVTEDQGFVRFTRSDAQYPDPEALSDEASALHVALPDDVRRELRCLRDLRAARGNNDPAFEAVLKTTRLQIFKGWGRLAALMKSPSGVLHCQRLFGEQGIEALVTTDEQEAIAFLTRD